MTAREVSNDPPGQSSTSTPLKTGGLTPLPFNAELYYNNILVAKNQVIYNLDPNKMKIKFTDQTLGDTSIYFYYSFMDQADVKDPSPARYTIMWFIPLPATGLQLTATLNESNTNLKWLTLSEQGTSHFAMERSVDNINFTTIADNIKAAGESVSRLDYQMMDNIENLLQESIIYYRVKLVDLDGHVTYSNVAPVRLVKSLGISSWPNPFRSAINININAAAAQTLTIKLSDLTYRTIRSYSQHVPRGASQVSINDLEKLPSGMYLLEVREQSNRIITTEKFIKTQ